jgi:hypothetical protein
MSNIPPIEDAYIDSVIKSSGPLKPNLNKTQGIELRAMVKLLRDRLESEIAEHYTANQASLSLKVNQLEFQTGLDTKIALGEKGQANGVATLDVNGKIPVSQLSEAILGSVNYQGNYDAVANNPELPPASGSKGKYYIIAIAGNQQGLELNIGDWIISNGDVWQKVDNSSQVASVNGLTGAVTVDDVPKWNGEIYDPSVNNDSLDALMGYNSSAGKFTHYDLGYIKGSLATSLQDVTSLDSGITTNDITAGIIHSDFPSGGGFGAKNSGVEIFSLSTSGNTGISGGSLTDLVVNVKGDNPYSLRTNNVSRYSVDGSGNHSFNGEVKYNSLAGTGERVVVADADGKLGISSLEDGYVKLNGTIQSGYIYIDDAVYANRYTFSNTEEYSHNIKASYEQGMEILTSRNSSSPDNNAFSIRSDNGSSDYKELMRITQGDFSGGGGSTTHFGTDVNIAYPNSLFTNKILGSNLFIGNNTTDGADNQSLILSSSSDAGPGFGAFITLSGNEYPYQEGAIVMIPGYNEFLGAPGNILIGGGTGGMISLDGDVKSSSLAGSGDRLVSADTDGKLVISSQEYLPTDAGRTITGSNNFLGVETFFTSSLGHQVRIIGEGIELTGLTNRTSVLEPIQLSFYDGSTYRQYIQPATLTANSTITLPNMSGVAALIPIIGGTAPTPTGTGIKGQVVITGGYRYECTATNTWVRSAIETTW